MKHLKEVSCGRNGLKDGDLYLIYVEGFDVPPCDSHPTLAYWNEEHDEFTEYDPTSKREGWSYNMTGEVVSVYALPEQPKETA